MASTGGGGGGLGWVGMASFHESARGGGVGVHPPTAKKGAGQKQAADSSPHR